MAVKKRRSRVDDNTSTSKASTTAVGNDGEHSIFTASTTSQLSNQLFDGGMVFAYLICLIWASVVFIDVTWQEYNEKNSMTGAEWVLCMDY